MTIWLFGNLIYDNLAIFAQKFTKNYKRNGGTFIETEELSQALFSLYRYESALNPSQAGRVDWDDPEGGS